ncbi:MAG: GlpG protein [Paraglaciecola sp.]|jgi:GlpG protein
MTQRFILTTFSEERAARLLVNYLQSQHIGAQYIVEVGEHSHSVVLLDEQQQQQARNIANEFVSNPDAHKYQQAAWDTGKSVKLSPVNYFSAHKLLTNLKEVPVTSVVLVLCIIIYLLAAIGVHQPYAFLSIQPLAELFKSQQWWRLVGPALIHFSVLHIVFNVLWWWMLGGQIERKFGKATLLALFTTSAILSNVGQLLVSGVNFGGLSGVVYALVGCVWWLGWLRPKWGLFLPKPMVGFLLVWLVIGYADILWVSMANTAHTVGLFSGCLFAVFLDKIAKNYPK